MENVEVKQEIKNSDDGKGILITNDAIEQIANLLKGQSDKKALRVGVRSGGCSGMSYTCLLYTSDAADDLLCVDLGGRRIIKNEP